MAVPFSRESPFTKLSQEVAHCRPRPRTGNPWPMTDTGKKKLTPVLKVGPALDQFSLPSPCGVRWKPHILAGVCPVLLPSLRTPSHKPRAP